jgi:hypothetical protein
MSNDTLLTEFDPVTSLACPDQPEPRCIVRLKTCAWHDRRGIHQRKSLRFLRRLSEVPLVLEEDLSCFGAEDVLARVIDFSALPDGVYEVVPCNYAYHAGASEIVEDYDYRLIPFTP